MGEFSQWRRSIGDLLAATERNLIDVDSLNHNEAYGRGPLRDPPPLTAFPRPASAPQADPPGAQRDQLAHTQAQQPGARGGRQAFAVVERSVEGGQGGVPVYQMPSDGVQRRGGDGGVYVDVALAYKVDNLTLSVAVLQKDFDLFKAQRIAKDEDVARLSLDTEEAASLLKTNFAKLERKVNDRLNHVDDMALEAYNSVYSRTPGVGVREAALVPPSAPLDEHNRLKAKVEYLEKMLMEQEQRPRVEDLVRDAVDDVLGLKVDDLSREAGQVARKAAASEVKNRFDYVENELAAALGAQEEKLRAEWGRAMAEFKAEQRAAMEKTVSQAVDGVAHLKSQTASLSSWRDVVEARTYKGEEERTQQLTRMKAQADEAIHDLRMSVDKQFDACDERIKRRVDEARLQLVDEERLLAAVAPLKHDVQTNLDLLAQTKQQQEAAHAAWEQRLKKHASDLVSSVAATSSDLLSQISDMKDDALASHQEFAARLAAVKGEVLDRVRAADDAIRGVEDAAAVRLQEESAQLASQVKRIASDAQAGHREHAATLVALQRDLERVDTALANETRAIAAFREAARGEMDSAARAAERAERGVEELQALRMGAFKDWATGEVKGLKNASEGLRHGLQVRDELDEETLRRASADAAAAAVKGARAAQAKEEQEQRPPEDAQVPPPAKPPTHPHSAPAPVAYPSDTDREGGGGWSSGYETGGTGFTTPGGGHVPLNELRAIAEECRLLRSQAVSAVVQQVTGSPSAEAAPRLDAAPTAADILTRTRLEMETREAGVPPVGSGGSVLAAARSALQSAARLGIDVTSGGMEADDLVPYSNAPGEAGPAVAPSMIPSSPTATRELIARFKATRAECTLPPHLATLTLPLSESEDADAEDDVAVSEEGDPSLRRHREGGSSERTKHSNWSSWRDFTPTSVTSHQHQEEDLSLLEGLDLEGGSSNT